MGEDAEEDVDAMLEAALQDKPDKKKDPKKKDRSKSPDDKKKRRRRSRSKDKDRKRSRSRSKDRKRKRSSRSRSKERRRRSGPGGSRSPPPWRSGGGGRGGRGGPPGSPPGGPPAWGPRVRSGTPPWRRNSPPREGRRLPGPERRDVMPFTPRKSPPKGAKIDLNLEERDARTVFIMQLGSRIRPRDLEEFFSSVGRVRDVRIITDSRTRKSKGIAYVEFWEIESVALALGLNGQRLLGAPLLIQPTQAEKNRVQSGSVGGALGFAPINQPAGPCKLYVGSLHFNITEEMLRGIFDPFGRVENIQLILDDGGRSRGYGFVTFRNGEDGKRAMEQLNGFELAGRPIKVGTATAAEHSGGVTAGIGRNLDTDESDRTGIDLGTAGRIQLMARLAEGTGMSLPNQAQQVLSMSAAAAEQQQTPAIATQCFMLSNMFDLNAETESGWERDIKDDVIEECSKNGGVLHIYVDKESAQGNVYVKCPSVASAVASVNALHGRWFAGKVITANYVPVSNYHQLFADAMKSTTPLQPSYKSQILAGGAAGAVY